LNGDSGTTSSSAHLVSGSFGIAPGEPETLSLSTLTIFYSWTCRDRWVELALHPARIRILRDAIGGRLMMHDLVALLQRCVPSSNAARHRSGRWRDRRSEGRGHAAWLSDSEVQFSRARSRVSSSQAAGLSASAVEALTTPDTRQLI
jgi:hypothetical protein